MLVTQKKQYALRAVFELAKNQGLGPMKTSEISEAQAIPLRFLEVILGQLKRQGLVKSKRGFQGGYELLDPPEAVTVGKLFGLLDDFEASEHKINCVEKQNCPFLGSCAFMPMWDKVHDAIRNVYDQTTLKDLMEAEETSPFPPV